jgi:membrane protein
MAAVSSLISETFNEWMEDKAQRLGAALAYYAAFSIAPLLIIVVAVVDFLYKGTSLTYIQSQIGTMIGSNGAEAVVATIRGARASGGGVTATIIGILTLILGATGVFTSLQDAMNTIWEVTPKPRSFWADMLRSRVLSFALVVAICFLLLVSLVLSAVLAAVSEYFKSALPMLSVFWPFVDIAISFAITTLLFASIYKILPDVDIAWSDVWIGAAVTAALFAIGKLGIGLYLGRSSFSSAYGAAGSFLVMLAWVYYSSQILFLGAEFTKVYANHYGTQFRPSRGAILLSEQARIHQGIPHFKTIEEAVKKDDSQRAA